MSKALLQQHAAKALRERAEQDQQQTINEHVRLAQQVIQAQQVQLDLRAQTIMQVNRENAALRGEVDKLIIELNDYDNAIALENSIAEEEVASPLLPAYADLSPQHGFEDYEDVSITGECKE